MPQKLLIVDDEPFTVDMLETFLQINGFETVGAFNGEDGLVLVKVEQPELVILDLMLPDIEGYEVCQRIRNYPASADLPVLILSARAEAASKERAMNAGADGYLVKPVQFPQLLSELNRLLSKPRSMPVTDTAAPPTDVKPEEPKISSVPLVTPPEVKPPTNGTGNSNSANPE
jgi:DNA-binding response OmpR family regulator